MGSGTVNWGSVRRKRWLRVEMFRVFRFAELIGFFRKGGLCYAFWFSRS